ncbi:cytochrome P450 [Aspergillus chevalieri]|uniref:Cytochrome P450 n=1 Tax=Aspergillus chevalieri TaxID=182096 RepID=A0A7R7VFW8_ASPCH|nr:uncharacterized protein ACHE_11278S [Aspergillus chevalieri]BCR83876.1 hypothetical protein ACHE_11278S [Aspergillus chevalieri]
MANYLSLADNLIKIAKDALSESTWMIVLVALAVTCITTRIITGFQCCSSKTDAGDFRPVRMAPYWFPWLGHSLSFAWNMTSCVRKARDYMGEPVFGLVLGGTKQNVVASPSMAQSVFAFRGASNSPFIDRVMERVFGDSGIVRKMNPADRQELHQYVSHFLQEPFITEATNAFIRRIQRETPNLVTFSWSMVDQVPWERASEVTVENIDGRNVCEADLFALVRNFSAHITTAGFFGQALLEDFPNLFDDLWVLDGQFPTLSRGAPHWLPIPGLPAAYKARSRLLQALATFQEAFIAWDDGRDPGVKFRDLDDVAEPIKQRARTMHKMGFSSMASASAHLSMLWAMNGNTTNIVFWNLIRVCAEPTLLEEIRKEIAPYVKASRPSREETGFPFEEPPQVTIDSQGLFNSCPLLKASFYETLRLDSAGFSLKELSSDLTLTESKEEAANGGLKQPRVYKLSKGDNIAISHGALQNDPRYFSNPSQYDPLRFITTDPDTGAKRAEMHTIKPFGGGVVRCKGRVLAERGNLAFIAAIVTMWDIEPVRGKQLVVPGRKASPGTFSPKKDVRVRMRARI